MVTAGATPVEAKKFFQPTPEAAAFRVTSWPGFVAETATTVTVVAPATALVGTAARAAPLVGIMTHVVF